MSNESAGNRLLKATEKGDRVTVETLLGQGCDANSADYYGWTGLHFVAQNGHAGIAELLLSNGARADVIDKEGWTPLHFAAERGLKKIAELLILNGADVDARAKADITPLHATVKCGQLETARALIENGADVNARDKDGETALFIASQRGYQQIVELVLAAGADTQVETSYGTTPLSVAADRRIADSIDTRGQSGSGSASYSPRERQESSAGTTGSGSSQEAVASKILECAMPGCTKGEKDGCVYECLNCGAFLCSEHTDHGRRGRPCPLCGRDAVSDASKIQERCSQCGRTGGRFRWHCVHCGSHWCLHCTGVNVLQIDDTNLNRTIRCLRCGKPAAYAVSSSKLCYDVLPCNGPRRYPVRLGDVRRIRPKWPGYVPPEVYCRDDPLFHFAEKMLASSADSAYPDPVRLLVWSPYPTCSYCFGHFGLHTAGKPWARYWLFPTPEPTQQNHAVAQLIIEFSQTAKGDTEFRCWVDALRENELTEENRKQIAEALENAHRR